MITRFTIGLKRYEVRDIKVKDLYFIIDTEKYQPKTAAVEIISHLSGCPVEDLKKLKPYQLNPLFGLIMDKLSNNQAPLQTEIKLKGEHYGFIKLDELTIGELADLELIKADADGNKKAHEILSILYRPVTGFWRDKYTIEDYDGVKSRARAEDFLELDLDVMVGAIFFLTSFIQTYTNLMKERLEEELIQTMKEVVDTTPKPNKAWLNSGQRFFTRWLDKIHLN